MDMTENWVFLNGDFIPERLATIPITDRGFLFGEGIFTTMRVHQGKCELLQGHLQRLQRQATDLNFHLPSLQWGWIEELIQRNQAGNGTWRLKVIITIKQESIVRTMGNLLATLHPYQGRFSEPCTLCLFPYPIEGPLAHVKSLSYLDHLYVRNYAQQRGYDDAITRTREGILLETGCSNLFWIDREKCWVPDLPLPYLKGVFLQTLLSHFPLPIHFVQATLDEIPSTASLYTCNALTHACPVLSVDHQAFPRNPQWEKLLQKITADVLKTATGQ
jgi:4-amino-4-deoxychorismate lyase